MPISRSSVSSRCGVPGIMVFVSLHDRPRDGQGGEDVASAVPIELDTLTTGTTAGFADDLLALGCGQIVFPSPDVVYSYVPGFDHNLTVSVCGTSFQSQVYIRDARLVVLQQVNGVAACNTFGCEDEFGEPQGSQVDCVPVIAGETYYVIVDTLGAVGGTYEITLTTTPGGDPACVPCHVDPAPGDTIEPPDCGFGDPAHNDQVNGGCDASPPAFMAIACDETICGTTWFDGTRGDQDWYRFTTSAPAIFTIDVVGEFQPFVTLISNDGVDDCAGIQSTIIGGSQPCILDSAVTQKLPPGTHWFSVQSGGGWNVIDCDDGDGGYCATITCQPVGPCVTDFDADGVVGFQDLILVLANWGPCARGAGSPGPSASSTVEPAGPCLAECLPGDIVEPDDCLFGEPPDDVVNGGCNFPPNYPMSPLACGDAFCGTAYFDGSFRDLDWFRVVATEATRYTFDATCEFANFLARVDNFGFDDCTESFLAEFTINEPCEEKPLVTDVLDPGVYFFILAPQFTDIVDCSAPAPGGLGANYRATLGCNEPAQCPWDLDQNGIVGFEDLLRVLAEWGPCPAP